MSTKRDLGLLLLGAAVAGGVLYLWWSRQHHSTLQNEETWELQRGENGYIRGITVHRKCIET
jgi:hypothetical protein